MNIRSLANQGYSQRAIAKLTGLHRLTVKKYLENTNLPVYKQINRKDMLKPYKPLIQGWLEQQDYQATRIHELLTGEGFCGSYPTVRRYVRKIKEQRDRKAYIRFETIPGLQAQVDFGDFQIVGVDGNKIETIYCFIMVLGYSRHMYIEFIEDCTMTSFLTCHQHAFGFFGGVPTEILYDNMKNVVIKRLVGSTIQWNQRFAGFALHYGFKPAVTPPYSPWTKGKVERPIKYVRERFWRGYAFTDITRTNNDVRRWVITVAGTRIHGTTKEKVLERFNRERTRLSPIPSIPYDISERVYRKVYKDCQLSFGGNRYVVPHECAGTKVLLKVRDGIVRIFHDERMVALYRIPEEKGKTLAHPGFYRRLREDHDQIKRKYRNLFGKAKATRGLLKDGLQVEVARRPLSVYETLLTEEVYHV